MLKSRLARRVLKMWQAAPVHEVRHEALAAWKEGSQAELAALVEVMQSGPPSLGETVKKHVVSVVRGMMLSEGLEMEDCRWGIRRDLFSSYPPSLLGKSGQVCLLQHR